MARGGIASCLNSQIKTDRERPAQMARMLNEKNGNAEAELVNAAYGLVQGIYGDGDMSSDAGYREWNKPEVQAAAMAAAKAFLATARPPLKR